MNNKEGMDRLTPKQQKFVQEYLVDFNATDSAIRAGYVTKYPNRVGWELLQKPHIKEVLAQAAQDRASKFVVKPDYVLRKVMKTIDKAEEDGAHNAVLKGCELLARHLGMFIERTEISGPDGGAIQYERVKEAADAFTSAISSLIERGGEGGIPLIVEQRDKS